MKFIYETDRLILKLLGEDDALQFFSFISRTEMSLSHMKPYTRISSIRWPTSGP